MPDGARVMLQDASTGAVDSIDRLLEVDEGITLEVISDTPSCLSQAVSTSTTAAMQRPVAGSKVPMSPSCAAGASGVGGPLRSCRMDIPVSEWTRTEREREEEEAGDGKYRKKRRGAASKVARLVLALAAVGGVLYFVVGRSGTA